MAEQKAVRTRRRVIAIIVVLESALLLCRWLFPYGPDTVATMMRYDFVPLDMLLVVALVLLATWALKKSPISDDGPDITTMRGYATFVLVVTLALAGGCMLIATVIGGWLFALEMTAYLVGFVALMLLVLFIVPLAATPAGKRVMTRFDRAFAAVGRSTPVRKAARYFAADDIT